MQIQHRYNLVLILYLIKMKRIVFLLMFVYMAGFAQKNINNYKYVIVPSKFGFLNKTDKYQTSSLVKFLLKKEGFEAFLDNEKLPHNLNNNNCIALEADLKDYSKLFKTKVVVELKDCRRNIVFTSALGESRSKEYKKSYHEAIRNAFQSLQYSYQPINKRIDAVVNVNKPKLPVVKNTHRGATNSTVATRINREQNRLDRRIGEGSRTVQTNNRLPLLEAKPVNDGFVLLNVKKEPVFALLPTQLDKVFVIKNKNGLLYKNQSNGWTAEFFDVYGAKVVKNYAVRGLRKN